MPTALVLGGGGARGGFAFGAVRYVVGPGDVQPSIVTGTSAGAIIAAKLAEARTQIEFQSAADSALEHLRAIRDSSDVFTKQPWLSAFDGTSLGSKLDEFVTQSSAEGRGHRRGWTGRIRNDRIKQAALVTADVLGILVRVLSRIPSIKHGLEQHSSAVLDAGPLRNRLVDFYDPAKIRRPGLTLRLGVCELATGETHYVTEQGKIVASDGATIVDSDSETVDIVDAVLASSAEPSLFAPVELAGRTYVDGGLRQFVPLDVAGRQGADRAITVLNIPIHTRARQRDWSRASLLRILHRTLIEIVPHEVQIGNLSTHHFDHGVDNTVIAPTVRLAGRLDFDADVLAVSLDYGEMRASEMLADVDDDTRAMAMQLTDAIVLLRVQRARTVASPASKKSAVFDWLIDRALERRRSVGLFLPAAAETWSKPVDRPSSKDLDAAELTDEVRDVLGLDGA